MPLLNSNSTGKTDKTSVSVKVEDFVRKAVYEGRLHPRERIIEGDLAHRLGVSRGTVREAVLRLERDGLVVTTPRRGTFIRDISVQDIRVVFRMRGKLEGLCVRYMREAKRPETEAVLREALRKLKAAAAANDNQQLFYADMELHYTVWKLSEQPQLYRTLNAVVSPFIFQIARIYEAKFPVKSIFEGHKRYVDIILKTPLDRVERAVEQYFQRLLRDLALPADDLAPRSDQEGWLPQQLWTGPFEGRGI